MDNKLSELSKSLYLRCVDRGTGEALYTPCGKDYPRGKGYYSQEYVSALLAELEAKDKLITTVTEEREFWRERVEGAEKEREEFRRRFNLERSYAEDADKHIAALEARLMRRKVGYQKNVAHKQAMNVQLEKELQEMTASNRRHVAALELAQLRIVELEAERDAVPGKASMWLIGEREIPTKVFSVANEAALRGETVVTLYKRLQAGFKREGGE